MSTRRPSRKLSLPGQVHGWPHREGRWHFSNQAWCVDISVLPRQSPKPRAALRSRMGSTHIPLAFSYRVPWPFWRLRSGLVESTGRPCFPWLVLSSCLFSDPGAAATLHVPWPREALPAWAAFLLGCFPCDPRSGGDKACSVRMGTGAGVMVHFSLKKGTAS